MCEEVKLGTFNLCLTGSNDQSLKAFKASGKKTDIGLMEGRIQQYLILKKNAL